MSVRIFRCSDCGHKMRLSGRRCGLCFNEKSIWQRPLTYLMLFLALLVVVYFYSHLSLSQNGAF